MASLGLLESLVGGLEDRTKRALTELIRAAFPNLRIGPVETAKAENFNAFKLTSTTATSTSEFSIEHAMGRTPYLAHQVVDLSAVGARLGVALEVTRAADDRRIYLKASAGDTNAVFSLYVE